MLTTPSVNQAPLGSPGNPLKMAFVPSADSQKVLASGQPLADLLSQQTGLSFQVSVPTSYAAVIEAMGANNVDVGWLAPFAYVLAHDKFQSTVILSSVRGGSPSPREPIANRSALSTMRRSIPRRASSMASVSPVGPAPTISTCGSTSDSFR